MSLERMQSKRALQIQCVFGTDLLPNRDTGIENYVFSATPEEGVDYIGVEIRCNLQCETYWPDGVREPGLTDDEKRDMADTIAEFARAQARRMLGICEYEPVRGGGVPPLTFHIEMAHQDPKYLDPHTAPVARRFGSKVRMRSLEQGTSIQAQLHQFDDELNGGDPPPQRAEDQEAVYINTVSPEQHAELRRLMAVSNPAVMSIQPSLRPLSRGTSGPEPHQRNNSRRIARDSNGSEESEIR